MSLVSPKSHHPSLSVFAASLPPSTFDAPPSDIDLPLAAPLSSSLFLGDHFDVSDFLLGRRHTALDELRSELRAYLTTLRTSLVAVINTEYESFIGLSLGLRQASVSSSLTTIRRPVMMIREDVSRVKDALEGMRDEMDRVLEERKAVREVKARMRRLLEMEDVVVKVEGLLKLGEGSVGARELERIVDSPAKRIERIAGEYNQMLYLLEKAGDVPFVRSLDGRIARITSTLHLDLSQLLTTILAAPLAPSYRESLTVLLRTYASLNLIHSAEELVRKTVVRPFVLSSIHREVLNSPMSPDIPATPTMGTTFPVSAVEGRGIEFYAFEPIETSESEPLADLYNRILRFISQDCGVLLDVAERTLGSTAVVPGLLEEKRKKVGYEVLTNVVWEEVVMRLMAELGHVIFAAGRPSTFHRNYVLTTTFISHFERLSPTLPSLLYLRSLPSYQTLLKRFQLPVYYQLRFKEIVSSVERSFEGSDAAGAGVETFLLSESEAVWKALNKCWSEDVFLGELAGRFWKLTLQLVSRYRTWLHSVVPKYVPPTARPLDGAPARTPIASPGGTRPGTPSPSDDAALEESTLRRLTVLIADSQLMVKKVSELFEERIVGLMPSEEDGTEGSTASEALTASLASLSSLLPSLSSQIVVILIKRCAEHLKLVKSVASQVRASTRKGPPTEPSYFIPNILKDLRGYLGGVGKVVEVELRTKWALAVVEEVASRYAAILASQKKTEDGLRRLKKSRQGISFFSRTTAATDDPSVDDSKVKMQMLLDVDSLGKDAGTLGVDVTDNIAFEALRNAIVDTAEEGASLK